MHRSLHKAARGGGGEPELAARYGPASGSHRQPHVPEMSGRQAVQTGAGSCPGDEAHGRVRQVHRVVRQRQRNAVIRLPGGDEHDRESQFPQHRVAQPHQPVPQPGGAGLRQHEPVFHISGRPEVGRSAPRRSHSEQ